MSLRTIDFKEKKFTCGGRTFYVQDSLSFNRFRELQRISIEFGFSTTFVELFKEIQKAYDLVQTIKNSIKNVFFIVISFVGFEYFSVVFRQLKRHTSCISVGLCWF